MRNSLDEADEYVNEYIRLLQENKEDQIILSGNINGALFQPFMQALKQNTSLKEFDINHVTKNADALIKAVKQHTSIKHLSISDVSLSSAIDILSDTLQKNSVLFSLSLRQIQINAEQLKRIMEGVQKSKSLKSFTYYDRNIDSHTMVDILIKCLQSTTLNELAFPIHSVTQNEMELIIQELQKNNNIIKFILLSDELQTGCIHPVVDFISANLSTPHKPTSKVFMPLHVLDSKLVICLCPCIIAMIL